MEDYLDGHLDSSLNGFGGCSGHPAKATLPYLLETMSYSVSFFVAFQVFDVSDDELADLSVADSGGSFGYHAKRA